MLIEDEIYQEISILVLVILVDIGLRTIWDEFVNLRLPENVHFHCEWLVKFFLKVRVLTLQYKVNTCCHLWLILIEIFKGWLDIQQFFVASHRQVKIQDVLIVNCNSHQHTYQLELYIRLKSVAIEPKHAGIVVVSKHSISRIE
jgi:hypothetical protein